MLRSGRSWAAEAAGNTYVHKVHENIGENRRNKLNPTTSSAVVGENVKTETRTTNGSVIQQVCFFRLIANLIPLFFHSDRSNQARSAKTFGRPVEILFCFSNGLPSTGMVMPSIDTSILEA